LLRGRPERRLPIDAQRMAGRKTILRQRIAYKQNDVFRHGTRIVLSHATSIIAALSESDASSVLVHNS
jgi:hypothetical protein